MLLLMAIGPALCRAQGACFRPRPAPECPMTWLTEVSLERRAGRLPGGSLYGWQTFGSALVGGMANVSPRWGFGGGLVMIARGPDDDEDRNGLSGRLGVVARARRWLGREIAVDASAGLWQVRGGRPMVEVSVELGGVLAATAGVRGDRVLPQRAEAYVGLRFGAEAALAASCLALLRFGMALAS